VERQHIRAALPDVTVIELPEDPMQYARVLRESPVFERLTLSEEDRERGQYYVAQRERTQLEQSVGSKEDFYRSLQQEAEVAPVSPATLARVAQLTQKTNQFNVTTRRYTEQEISDKAASADWGVYSIRVRDRFADNGLVGVAILHFNGGVCEIDTLLLSCRVIGRTVETAFLAWLIERAEARGAKRIAGWFLPTKKNAPAKDFYASHGFDRASEDSKGVLWALDLPQSRVVRPEWVRLIAPDGD
jgi:FkbH-like protein